MLQATHFTTRRVEHPETRTRVVAHGNLSTCIVGVLLGCEKGAAKTERQRVRGKHAKMISASERPPTTLSAQLSLGVTNTTFGGSHDRIPFYRTVNNRDLAPPTPWPEPDGTGYGSLYFQAHMSLLLGDDQSNLYPSK